MLRFVHDGEPGAIDVTVEQPDDPTRYGQAAELRGFPTCTAMVEHEALGYRALFGWVQLVRSTDNSSCGAGFEMDPFVLFEDAASPYAFFGVKPVLFDAPARTSRRPLAWLAHSFLARTPLDDSERPVEPLAGFSWGFDIDDVGDITLRQPRELTGTDWGAHLDYLRDRHPNWTFLPWGEPSR